MTENSTHTTGGDPVAGADPGGTRPTKGKAAEGDRVHAAKGHQR